MERDSESTASLIDSTPLDAEFVFLLAVLTAFSVVAATPPKRAICAAMATPLPVLPDPATCAKNFGITVFAGVAGREKAVELL